MTTQHWYVTRLWWFGVFLVGIVVMIWAIWFRIGAPKEPVYEGKLLREWLGPKQGSGKQSVTLKELMSVQQVFTGNEPDIATFRLAINYDAATNIGILRLLVDSGNANAFQDCSRGTNGDCLIEWNTTYDAPGSHTVQSELLWSEGWHSFKFLGPITVFYTSNVCQFSPFDSEYSMSGAILSAKLAVSNASYVIELQTQAGQTVRTLAGNTSSGEIEEHWDLTCDDGARWTNSSLNALFHITEPHSGTRKSLQKLTLQ